ncbi:MAG: hypothetical protein HUJ68_08660 [Clostridia bacterium]|nr:hypothetical protein [Clostridia bacterium]
MKLIGIKVYAGKIFDICKAWTQRRVLDSQNPNYSQANLNYAYGMTEDDEKYFFKTYFKRACAEAAAIIFRLAENLTINGEDVIKDTSYKYSYFFPISDNPINSKKSFVVFFMYVNNNFPVDVAKEYIENFLQYRILYYWYWEKNMESELPRLELQYKEAQKELRNLISKFSQEGCLRVPYNDGFCQKPFYDTRVKKELLNEKIFIYEDGDNGNSNLVSDGYFNDIFNFIFY